MRYCIVLYLYIYIALLAVHTNQKRFQRERPRQKRAVLRERKEALGSPVNKVDRVEGGNWFQSVGTGTYFFLQKSPMRERIGRHVFSDINNRHSRLLKKDVKMT